MCAQDFLVLDMGERGEVKACFIPTEMQLRTDYAWM